MILCCRYTMTKSTSVIFILMFALLFGLEQWVGSNRSYCIMSEKLIALFKVKSYDRILVFKDPSVLWGEDYIITSTQHYFFFSKNPTFYMIKFKLCQFFINVIIIIEYSLCFMLPSYLFWQVHEWIKPYFFVLFPLTELFSSGHHSVDSKWLAPLYFRVHRV